MGGIDPEKRPMAVLRHLGAGERYILALNGAAGWQRLPE